MKTEKIITVLSIGAIVGFIAGLIYSLNHIIANQYFQYRMYRLIALVFQDHLNKWVMVLIISFIILLLFSSLTSSIWVLVLKKFSKIEIRSTDKSKYLIKVKWGNLSKLIKINALLLLIFLLVLNLYISIEDEVNTSKEPNVIFILIDCLRPDHLGCYGYKRDTSPTIDRLAQEGIIFTNAYCNAPWTKPSVASIFTSLYPNVHKVINYSNVLPEGVLTIAEILKNHGYKTYFFNGGNVFIKKEFNFDQGFDEYTFLSHKSKNAMDLTCEILAQISKIRGEKYFAYLHYMDAHTPYNKNEYNNLFIKNGNKNFEPGSPKSRSNVIRELTYTGKLSAEGKKNIISLYDGQIRFIDENIKKIVSFLMSENRLKDTVIIITSDHGEEFWEHNNFEHGHTLYNELLRVPLIITGNKIEHSEIASPVSLIDLSSTILEIVNIEADRFTQQGVSLLRTLNSKKDKLQSSIFAVGTFYGDEKYCLIKDNKKIIFNTGKIAKKAPLVGYKNKNRLEFYDLEEDLFERENLANNEGKMVYQLEDELGKFKKKESIFQVEYDETVIVIDKKLKEKLSSLGYLH